MTTLSRLVATTIADAPPGERGRVRKPERIRLSRAKGWRMPPNTVVVSRPGPWGNPFIVGKDGTRAYCVELYAHMLNGFFALCRTPSMDELKACRTYAV